MGHFLVRGVRAVVRAMDVFWILTRSWPETIFWSLIHYASSRYPTWGRRGHQPLPPEKQSSAVKSALTSREDNPHYRIR